MLGLAVLTVLAAAGGDDPAYRGGAFALGLFAAVCLARMWRRDEAQGDSEAALRTRVQALEAESLADPVTGLGNIRSFQVELQREVARAARHGHSVALALIEVDAFADVTETFGNLDGDRLLARLASSLGGRRAEDRTFRLTGGEFGLILPYTSAVEIAPLMESLRIETERSALGSTVTIGIADVHGQDDSGASLRQRAEAALSEAKRRGRNAVVSYRRQDQNPVLTAATTSA